MRYEVNPFRLSYKPADINFGRNCTSDLGPMLDELGCQRVMIVCGKNVSANKELMTPITDSIGDHLECIFSQSTPAKLAQTAKDGAHKIKDHEIDSIVAIGGGSAFDLATTMNLFDYGEATLAEFHRALDADQRQLDHVVPENRTSLLPLFTIPTTLAGADLTFSAEINVERPGGEIGSVYFTGEPIMPEAVFYDPALFETTPEDVLVGSIMNGFDKGIEILYSPQASTITDATGVLGLKILSETLPNLRETDDPDVMDGTIAGTLTCMYGISEPDQVKVSIVHAFGHAVRETFDVQQGVAHAIMVPHVLDYLLGKNAARKTLLAEAFDVPPKPDLIIEAVIDIRDSLELPTQLSELPGSSPQKITEAAKLVETDPLMRNCPRGISLSVEEIESLLKAAW